MKTAHLIFYLAFWAMAGSIQAQTFKPEEVGKLPGIELQVRGQVFATGFTKSKSGNWYQNLFFGDDTPRHVFRVRFRYENLPGEEAFPSKWALREVLVRGVVEEASDGPRITVTDASQIEVLPVDVEAVLRAPVDTDAERELQIAAWRQVLLNGDFARLEKQAAMLNETEPRFVSGLWQLAAFMAALSQPETQTEADWTAHRKALEAWKEAFPGSVTQRIAWASFLINSAWKIRGSGYASTVARDAWQAFKAELLAAQAVLESLPRSEWTPYAYQRSLVLAMGLGLPKEEVRPLLEEGMKRWPDYYDLYFAEAVRLLPRWHGRPGEWESWLAELALDEADLADEIYARVTWSLAHYYKNEQGVFKATAVEWPRVKRGFEVMRRRFPDSDWNLNAFARFSAYASDRPTALGLVQELAGKENTSFWGGWSYYDNFKRWAEKTEP